MLLFAEGLFRLDVTIAGDTLRTVVRNLSTGELTMGPAGGDLPSRGIGEVEVYEPAHSELLFSLGSGADTVVVSVQLATLRFGDRGTIRVTAQAILRGPAAPPVQT